jgi:hypothetical protein
MDLIARFIRRNATPLQRTDAQTAAAATADAAAAATADNAAAAAAAPEAEPERDDAPRGCGWFDSSHELHTGLFVTEHDSPDRVANELPLDVWLAWHLAGARQQPNTVCA